MRRLAISVFMLFRAVVVRADDQPAPAAPAQAAPTQTAPAQARITHVPLNETLIGDVTIAFEIRDPQQAGAVFVHVLTSGKEAEPIEALRGAHAYEAVIPKELLAPPGFSYFVTERMADGSERPVFADVAGPHPVRVTRPPDQEAELRRLDARDGQRSQVILAGEYVDFGDRTLDQGVDVHDRYYRLEAGYAYSFLTSIETIRLTLVRVRGQAADWSEAPSTFEAEGGDVVVDASRPGIDYGRAEVTYLANDSLRFRGSLLLGASQRGFEYGAGGSVIGGDPNAMSLELGVERITTLGATARLRLGFAALPRVPMGATIEVSSFPTGDDAGVRLLYDVGYRFGPITKVSLRGGYQGRTSVTGGPAFGGTFEYGF